MSPPNSFNYILSSDSMDIIGETVQFSPANYYYRMPQSLQFLSNQNWTVALTRFCMSSRVTNIQEGFLVMYSLGPDEGWNVFELKRGSASLPHQFLSLFSRSLPVGLKGTVELTYNQQADRFEIEILEEKCQLTFSSLVAEMLGFHVNIIYENGKHMAPNDYDLLRGSHYVHVMSDAELITPSFWGNDAENPQVYMLQSFCLPPANQSSVATFEPHKPLYLPLSRAVVHGIRFKLLNEVQETVKFSPPFAPTLFVLHFKRKGYF